MVLLVALLLAFLAQNLLTPYPLDFAATGAALLALALLMPESATARRPSARVLGTLIVVLVALWQLAPAGVSGIGLYALAAFLFIYETRGPTAELEKPAAPSPRREWLVVALSVAVSLWLCVYDNGNIPPGLHGDEAESGIEARNINAGRYSSLIGVGWYDQPLASFAVQAGGLRVFGDTVSGLRTTSALISVLTLPLVYLLARELFNRRVASLTLLLMAGAHWFIAYARLGINYNQTLLLQLVAVLGFWKGWQNRAMRWFALSGLASGAGLYLYFASRLVPLLLGSLALFIWAGARWRALRPPAPLLAPQLAVRHVALWATLMLVVFAPIGVFFVDHANEFSSRAAFVFLFSDTQWNSAAEKMRLYTGTTDVPAALSVQAMRYSALFNIGGARDGQYGNTISLLDYYTAAFFVLGLAFAVPRFREPRFALLLGWLVLTVVIGGMLTIESPFTPRLIGLMPVPFMLAAVALDQLWVRLRALFDAGRSTDGGRRTGRVLAGLRAYLPRVALVLCLAAAAYFNYWAYFDRYVHSIDGWAQREPATSVARYAAQLAPDQSLYVLGAPELFVWHGAIRFLAPGLRGFDVQDPGNELPIRDPQTNRATFVVLPKYIQWLVNLKSYYPNGVLTEVRRPWGELWYALFEVPADDIAAGR